MRPSTRPASVRALTLLESLATFSIYSLACAIVAAAGAWLLFHATSPDRQHSPIAVLEGNPVPIGKQLCGVASTAKLTLVNTSKHPVTIDHVQGYCGCLQFDLGKLPLTLAPKEKKLFTCRLAAPDDEGPIDQKFDFYLSSTETPYSAWIRGEAIMPLPRRVELGAFSPPISKEMRVRTVEGAAPSEITSAISLDKGIDVSVIGRDSIQVSIPSVRIGSIVDGEIQVRYKKGSLAQQSVRVHGVASGGLMADPERVVFGRLLVGEKAARRIRVRDVSNHPFDFSKSVIRNDYLTLEIRKDGPASAWCTVTANPTSPGPINERLFLPANDGHRGLILECVGMIENPANASNTTVDTMWGGLANAN